MRAKGRAWLVDQVVPEDERIAIERHLREFDWLGEDLKVIELDLARSALADEGVKRLMTIPGVDMVVAISSGEAERKPRIVRREAPQAGRMATALIDGVPRSRSLIVHSSRRLGGKHYGPGTAQERPHERGVTLSSKLRRIKVNWPKGVPRADHRRVLDRIRENALSEALLRTTVRSMQQIRLSLHQRACRSAE